MSDIVVQGDCALGFEEVRALFVENFDPSIWGDDADIGAAVCARVGGRTVIDLWGGHRDRARRLPWEKDTITCVFSVSKAIAAVCIHMLHSRGALDVDAPIAAAWPEFAQNGKAEITARMVMDQTAGLLCPDVPEGALWTPGVMTRALERMAPEWVPGTEAGYHSFTYGPILQDWVLRATGQTLGAHLRHSLAEPFGLNVVSGLTDVEDARCAELITNEANGTLYPFRHDPAQDVYHHWAALPRDEDFNSDDWRRHEFFSLAGHGNARGIAGVMTPLANGGQLDGVEVIAPDVVAAAISERWSGQDRFGQGPGRFASGFQMSDAQYPFACVPESLGFYGIGGSVGFADPTAQVSFSYCCNALVAGGAGVNPMSHRLIAAFYKALRRR